MFHVCRRYAEAGECVCLREYHVIWYARERDHAQEQRDNAPTSRLFSLSMHSVILFFHPSLILMIFAPDAQTAKTAQIKVHYSKGILHLAFRCGSRRPTSGMVDTCLRQCNDEQCTRQPSFGLEVRTISLLVVASADENGNGASNKQIGVSPSSVVSCMYVCDDVTCMRLPTNASA